MSKATLPVHSLLLALFPVLNLYIQNMGEIPIVDIATPALFLVAVAAALTVLLGQLLRSYQKAALIVSVFLIYSLTYSAAFQAARDLLPMPAISRHITNRMFLPLCTVLLAAAWLWVLRTRRDLRQWTSVSNVASTLLVLFAVGRIALFGLQNPSAVLPSVGGSTGASPGIDLERPASPPDIYYFVFDRYPSEEALREFYHFDNSELLDHLRGLGFQVVRDAHANYPMTHLSLASSLNLDYLGPNYEGRLHYRPMIRRNRAVRTLKAAGYRYIHVGGWYEPTRKSPLADRNVNHPWMLSEFTKALIRTTPYQLVLFKNQMAKEALFALEELEKIPSEPGPKLVFLHLLLPHPPYLFNADGSLAEARQTGSRSEAENFIEQLRFLNTRIARLVDAIVAKSPTPPVIVLQADEGPLLDPLEHGLSRTEMWRKRAGILNAYLLPGSGPPLPEDITPVNTFRYLFRRYFGSSVELLPERIYYWAETKPNGMAPNLYGTFPFVDITGELLPAAPAGRTE